MKSSYNIFIAALLKLYPKKEFTCHLTVCPLLLEELEMLEKLDSEPYFRIWLERLENHKVLSCLWMEKLGFYFWAYCNNSIIG